MDVSTPCDVPVRYNDGRPLGTSSQMAIRFSAPPPSEERQYRAIEKKIPKKRKHIHDFLKSGVKEDNFVILFQNVEMRSLRI